MPVLRRRSKMVSFRLSEQEYQGLVSICGARGARSLSDLARDAMQELLGSPSGSDSVGSVEIEFRKLHGRIEEIDRGLKRITQLLEEAGPTGEKAR
jgi:hypothetical protein